MKNNDAIILSLWEDITVLVEKIHNTEDAKNCLDDLQDRLNGLTTEDEQIALLRQTQADLKSQLKEIDGSGRSKRPKLLPILITTLAAVALVSGGLFWWNSSKNTKSSATIKTEQAPAKASIQEAPNEDFLIWNNPNKEGKMVANGSQESSLSGTAEEKLERMLLEAQHNQAVLEGYAKSFGINIPKDISWTVDVNGKKYLSPDAQNIFYQLKGAFAQFKAKNTDAIGVHGAATGVSDNNLDDKFVQDGRVRDYKSWNGIQIHYKGSEYYALDYCGNIVLPKVAPGIPTKNLPIPKEDPADPKPKDGGNTPPSNGGNTPPSTTPQPKKAEEAPQNNPAVIQGDTNNVRPGAGGSENAKVNVSPGTSHQGNSAAEVEAQQRAEAEAAEAQRRANEEAHQQAIREQQAALERQRKEDEQALAEAQARRDAEAAKAVAEAAQRIANEQKASTQTNDGVVDGW